MRVSLIDKRKVTKPIYIQGIKYILTSGKKKFFNLEEETISKLQKFSFLEIEIISEETKEPEDKKEPAEVIQEIKTEELETLHCIQEDLHETEEEDCTVDEGESEIDCETDDYSSMTIQQLKSILDEKGISYVGLKKKAEFISLLNESN